MRVMKVYTSESELKLFEKEFVVLHHLNQVSPSHLHLVKALDARLLNFEPKTEEAITQIPATAGVKTRSMARRVHKDTAPMTNEALS